MGIENIMYFALGLLAAGLLALLILPAVWRRAVRLTKKRIEAATPMTMAEFRADKDQLRAEFALSTRRLEMNVEALRRRLADQLRDINRKKNELGGMKTERDQHLDIVRELEEREGELRRRVLELEKEGTDLAQKLRMRDREYAEKVSQLEAAREAIRSGSGSGKPATVEGRTLSGNYAADISDLLALLSTERKRADFLENQNQSLLSRLERTDIQHAETVNAAANLRGDLARSDDAATGAKNELVVAEARMADAENRVTAILESTAKAVVEGERERDLLLAEKLGLEEQLETLRGKVSNVEETILADWDTDRIEQSHLRERLNDIASDVSRLVYALEGNGPPPEAGESLFDTVQRFSEVPEVGARPQQVGPVGAPANDDGKHAVSDRLKALRELQEER